MLVVLYLVWFGKQPRTNTRSVALAPKGLGTL